MDCTHKVRLIIEILYQEYIKDWAVFWNCLECNTTGATKEGENGNIQNKKAIALAGLLQAQ
mgnify:FL=1